MTSAKARILGVDAARRNAEVKSVSAADIKRLTWGFFKNRAAMIAAYVADMVLEGEEEYRTEFVNAFQLEAFNIWKATENVYQQRCAGTSRTSFNG